MSCRCCSKPANFRAKKCNKCGGYYNGNDGMSGIEHIKNCKPTKEYKAKMKATVKKLTDDPKFTAGLKKFNEDLEKLKK